MIKRRNALILAVGFAVAGTVAVVATGAVMLRGNDPAVEDKVAAPAEPALLPAPTIGADGMFVEAWFRPTTGDLSRDAALAASEGKPLAIFWELEGCEYCALLHNQALRIPALHAYVAERFYAVQLDYQGDKMIRDFDGVEAAERDMARRHRARGTPTIEFLATDGEVILRIPGYPQPAVLQGAFEYVDTGAYRESNINDWLQARGIL